jgi:hypothetical protein
MRFRWGYNNSMWSFNGNFLENSDLEDRKGELRVKLVYILGHSLRRSVIEWLKIVSVNGI